MGLDVKVFHKGLEPREYRLVGPARGPFGVTGGAGVKMLLCSPLARLRTPTSCPQIKSLVSLTRASVRSIEAFPLLNRREVFSAPTQLHPRCGEGPGGWAMASFS